MDMRDYDASMAVEHIIYTDPPTVPEWTLGDRLAKARNRAGLEQKHMARMFACSTAAVSAWERDENQPRTMLEVAKAWAKETNVPLDWLLLGVDEVTRSRWTALSALRLIPGGLNKSPEMIQMPLPLFAQTADN